MPWTNPALSVATAVPTDAAVTVNATTTALLAANTGRLSALLKNTGTQTVYLNQGASATTAGFPLNPGDALTIRHQLSVNGIVSSGTGTVYVYEEAR
jgi:hypothetical protein